MGIKAVDTPTDRKVRGNHSAQKHSADRMKIHKLADEFPLLDEDELGNLARSIKENGLRHPIYTINGEILDGRNRYEACLRAGVEPRFEEFTGTLDQQIKLVIDENINRRQLAPGQADAIIVSIEPLVEAAKKSAAERKSAKCSEAGKAKRKSAKSEVSKVTVPGRSPSTAAADLAAATGRSERGLERALRVKEADPDLLKKVKDNELPLKRADRVLRDRAAAAKREERTKRESGVSDVPAPDVRLGDFRQVLADVRDVDLVFTDPPYPRDFLPLWSDLSLWASRALKRGHLLVAYTGQYHLPEVIARLSEHLQYVWCGWLAAPGAACSVRQRPIMSSGKPVLVFSNGDLSAVVAQRRFTDTARSEGRTRDQHEWEQTQGPAAHWIDALTERGELVADPFTGSGTFALVAKTMGRRFVGAEVDPNHFETIRSQLS